MARFYAAFDNRGSRTPSAAELHALFADGATIARVTAESADLLTPEEFVAPRVAILTDGTLLDFHEWETEAETCVFGHIASRWSTYEKEGLLDGAPYRGGGRKFIHLQRGEDRWAITSILWQDRD